MSVELVSTLGRTVDFVCLALIVGNLSIKLHGKLTGSPQTEQSTETQNTQATTVSVPTVSVATDATASVSTADTTADTQNSNNTSFVTIDPQTMNKLKLCLDRLSASPEFKQFRVKRQDAEKAPGCIRVNGVGIRNGNTFYRTNDYNDTATVANVQNLLRNSNAAFYGLDRSFVSRQLEAGLRDCKDAESTSEDIKAFEYVESVCRRIAEQGGMHD